MAKARLVNLPATARVYVEPDAGFYLSAVAARGGADPVYGWEDHLAVLFDAGRTGRAVPNIAIGFNFGAPAVKPGASARDALAQVNTLTAGLNQVVFDRAYNFGLTEFLHETGAKPVPDPVPHSCGAPAPGDILLDGTWYSPFMLTHLMNATPDEGDPGSDGAGSDAERRDLLAKARAPYALRAKAPSDAPRAVLSVPSPFEPRDARRAGRKSAEAFMAKLRCTESAPTPGALRGATGQAFLSLLAVAATNARSIQEWTTMP